MFLKVIGVFILNMVFSLLSTSESCEEYELVCEEGRRSQVIEGTKLERECWKYRYKLDCQNKSKDDCRHIDPNLCVYASETCIEHLKEEGKHGAKICSNWKRNYSCEKEVEYEVEKLELKKNGEDLNSKELLCAFMCLDGNCDAVKKAEIETNEELAKSVGLLSSLKDAKRESGGLGDVINIFKGEPKFCSYHPLNFMNCCKDSPSGWGEAIKLGRCYSDELKIATLKSKKQCIDVGEFCKEKFLGACIERQKTYCCYDSVIARILTKSAKDQLGRSFGTAENPDCGGISLEDLQRVDFSKADFSDFYDYVVVPNIKLPDVKGYQAKGEKCTKEIEEGAKSLSEGKRGFNPSATSKVAE